MRPNFTAKRRYIKGRLREAKSNPIDIPILPPMGIMNQVEHQKLLSSILESTTDIVVYTDPQHKIRFMNKAGIERLGIEI